MTTKSFENFINKKRIKNNEKTNAILSKVNL